MASFLTEAKVLVLQILLKVFDICCDVGFGLVYRGRSKAIPPIRDQLLLEPAVSLAAKIRSGKVKSVDVIQAYITRIKEVQPFINAVVEDRFSDALRDAAEVDRLVESGAKSEAELAKEKPFLGIPLTTKNYVGVKGMIQDVGLVSRKGTRAEKDAEVIARMRDAGAIPICITNVPELCMWTECSNLLYGETRNPYDTTRTPGGSSGGEGSMIASAASLIGIGTDIGGSVRIPAFCNGIFAHKPTTGVLSNEGLNPTLEDELDRYNSTGPMCRYACDLLPMVRVMAGKNAEELGLNKQVDLKKIKIYYMDDDGSRYISSVKTDTREAVHKASEYFRESHGVKLQKVNFKGMQYGLQIWLAKLSEGNITSPFAKAFKDGKGKLNPYIEIILWLIRFSQHTLPAIVFSFIEAIGPKKASKTAKKFSLMGDNLAKELEELLGNDGVLIYPGAAEPASYRNQHVTRFRYIKMTSIFNVLRVPALSVPMGLNKDGLPVGVQVVANRSNDHLCLAVAVELEKAFGGWYSPAPIMP